MFPLAVLADCKLTHSLEYSDKCLSQDLYSHVNQKYFCQFGAMLSLKSADDYSLYGDSTLFLSVKQLWKLTAKPEHFFSWAIQFEWFMFNTVAYISMNEQIHIEESLLLYIYFLNTLTFSVFKSTSKSIIHTHTNTQAHKTWANTCKNGHLEWIYIHAHCNQKYTTGGLYIQWLNLNKTLAIIQHLNPKAIYWMPEFQTKVAHRVKSSD